MASLDIPFLVFSRSNFAFETNKSCFSDVLIQDRQEQDPGYEGGNDGPILALSDLCGEVIFYSLDVDSRTVVKKNTGENKTSKIHKTWYHLLLHPKLLLIPSISNKEKVGKLLDGVVVESPAKFILSTSDYLWVSLHDDNVIRIWSISDGRCLMFSPKDLFLTKLRRIFPIPTYDGYLLCFGEKGDVYIINMFRMRLLKHSSFDIDWVKHISLVKVDQSNIWILLTDVKGKISTWQIQTNVNGMNLQTIWSENDFDIDFKLKKALILPDEYSKDYKLVYSEEVLQIGKKNTSQTILVITDKEVNIVHLSDDVEDIVEIDKFKGIGDIIFATSIQKNEGIYILIITDTYDCYIDRYDQIPENTAPLIMVNLLEKSEINNHPVSSSRLEELWEGTKIQYDDFSKMLYIVLHEEKKFLGWFINDMLRNARYYTYASDQDIFRPDSIPLQHWSTDIFADNEPSENHLLKDEKAMSHSETGHNLISFNDIIKEEFKNINYYKFFYSGEKVTCTLIITAIEKLKKITPALVIGTNYGRIFIVSMFQRWEGQPNPIIVVDSHFGNQINGLFFASNRFLFSISEEGTFCITHISEKLIDDHFYQLEHYMSKVLPIQRKRFDKMSRDIQRDYKKKRRNSFTSYTKNLWDFVKIPHTKRFKDMSPFGINKILEVKDIESLRGQSKKEENKSDRAKPRLKKLREYAFVGEDNIIYLFSLKTMQIKKLLSADSHAIGVYYDRDYNYYFILTKDLNMLYYSKVTLTLERKGNFEDASNILCLDDIIQSIFTTGDIFQSHELTDISLNDFETFDKLCEKKNLYMKFGKHKTLDYLNLSLNLPLDYNELSIYSSKYTKALHDLLRIKPNRRQIKVNKEKRREMLKTLNSILYLNNHLYNSDANESDFKRTGVNFIKAHIGTLSRRGNNQQIMMVNIKTVINNLRRKFMDDPDVSAEEEDDDFDSDELPIGGNMMRRKRSSSFGQKESSHEFRRKLSRMAEGDDYEDYKGAQKVSIEGYSKMINKPKVMNVRKSSTASYHTDREFYSNDEWEWPIKLMSLFHPFRLSDALDMELEDLFKLSLPCLDIRQGIQGFGESFTFVIAKNKPKLPRYRSLTKKQESKFFNDMLWEVSQYQSSTITTAMLSMLVSVIEMKEKPIAEIINNWLYILLMIMKKSNAKNLSLSYIHKLLLIEDFNINSTARDVILRFFFYNIDIEKETHLLEEWSALLMDTYRQLKNNNKYIKGSFADPTGIPNFGLNSSRDHYALTKYFGELEIRGLIIISYYSLNYVQIVDPKIARRWSKLIIMLTRITVTQARENQMYMHLLNILLQLLSTGIRIYHMTYDNEDILEDVIKLLLHTYNDYKPTGQAQHSSIKLNDFNFYIVKVTNPELSLKRVAAKTLLEIGENFPHRFLAYIQKEAHSLQESHEFQRAILEILKQYIKFYGIALEPYLIQITQIVLKCLDPHDIPLRKNSLVDVTIILGILVKKFPMIDFHHDSQKLAVGTNIGPIAIYDVKTSTKWRVLEGHTGKISCLRFNSRGHYLVSYSATDLSLRLWRVGNTSFFSGIMGTSTKWAKTINLDSVPPKMPTEKKANNPFEMMNAKRSMAKITPDTSLQPEKEDEWSILDCELTFIGKKEREVILRREDRTSEQYKMK